MTSHEETQNTINENSNHAQVAHPEHAVHHRERKQLTTPMAIIIGSIIIAVGLVSYGYVSNSSSGVATDPKIFKGKSIGSNEPVFGVSKKVFVIEYSDTECPYCVSFNPTIEQIKNEYKDKVGFVYRFFPLTQIHPHAQKEAEAIACAEKIGGGKAFFDYMAAMFNYKTLNKTTQLKETGIKDLATQVGLDANALTECVSSGEMTAKVTESINDGVTAGVSGTPTTFVITKDWKGTHLVAMITGAQTYDYVKKAIEEALAK